MPAPELVLTPSPAQYEVLAASLEALRKAGAETNTQAVVDAVVSAAEKARAA